MKKKLNKRTATMLLQEMVHRIGGGNDWGRYSLEM